MSLSRLSVKLDAAVDRFDLGVKFEPRPPRLAERRGRGSLDAAERRIDQIARRGSVDLDRAGLDIASEGVDELGVARRDRGREAVLAVIGFGDRIFVALD